MFDDHYPNELPPNPKGDVFGLACIAAMVLCVVCAACASLPKPIPPAPPMPLAVRTVAEVVTAGGSPLTGATCSLEDIAGFGPHSDVTNGDGYVAWNGVAASLTDTAVHCRADGYVPLDVSAVLKTTGNENLPPVAMTPQRPPLPPAPPRNDVAAIQTTFQGLLVPTDHFGTVPWLDYYVTSPDITAADRARSYAAKHARGDTHQTINVSWAYREPGLVFAPDGRDLTNDLPTLRAFVREAIVNGFKVDLDYPGDGNSLAPNPDGSYSYNDPVGDTYGFEWLMANFARIEAGLGPLPTDAEDLHPFTCRRPGYDGVVPGWQPWNKVNQWLAYARTVVGPSGCLSLELSAGYWAWSGEHNDYETPEGMELDAVLYEFPYNMGPPAAPPANFTSLTNEQRAPWDQVWQISKRLLGSAWRRPAEQPADDDPGSYPDIAPRARGPLMRIGYEFDTYGFVRGLANSIIDAHRAYLRSIGWSLVG